MMDATKYQIGYYPPPVEPGHVYEWMQKDHIETAPAWCSVDLAGRQPESGGAYEPGGEAGVLRDAAEDRLQGDRGGLPGGVGDGV